MRTQVRALLEDIVAYGDEAVALVGTRGADAILGGYVKTRMEEVVRVVRDELPQLLLAVRALLEEGRP